MIYYTWIFDTLLDVYILYIKEIKYVYYKSLIIHLKSIISKYYKYIYLPWIFILKQ